MSVIVAIYDNCNITLFADGQVTRPDGSIQTGYGDKVLQITSDVAVGYGGITGPCEEINKEIKNQGDIAEKENGGYDNTYKSDISFMGVDIKFRSWTENIKNVKGFHAIVYIINRR